jgi:hypothetical protein
MNVGASSFITLSPVYSLFQSEAIKEYVAMRKATWLDAVISLALLTLTGCGRQAMEKPKGDGTPGEAKVAEREDTIRANLGKLSAEDRKLVEDQRFCAVENKNRLGSMGVPYKVMIQDQPVFLCCDACETRAKAHADRTFAKVQQLREATKSSAK